MIGLDVFEDEVVVFWVCGLCGVGFIYVCFMSGSLSNVDWVWLCIGF